MCLSSTNLRSILLLAATTPLWSSASSAQTGNQPQPGLGARDIFAKYTLPPLQDRSGDAVWEGAKQLQVMERARELHLDARAASDAWRGGDHTLTAAQALVQSAARDGQPMVFKGTRSSELNAVLASPGTHVIVVASQQLAMDAPIRIGGSAPVSLNLGQARLQATAELGYAIRIEKASDVRLAGGSLRGAGWGVLVAGSARVLVLGMEMEGLSGGGVVVTGSDDVVVWGNRLHGLGAAPVMLHGGTHRTTVAHNEIIENLGSSNWHAGIVLSDRNADLAANPTSLLRPDNFGVQEQRIPTRLSIPEDNVVALNHIAGNRSSGIYSDGASRNVIFGNHVEGNSKEGLCLDNGSAANVVVYNLLQANGKRWGKSDADLQRDFIFGFGRLADGSSPAKVPAISMDNAAYNQILFNEVDRNYGGGIKMVRTAYYNVVGLNTLSDNNEGQSERFHFFGVELGAANADVPVPDLNFTPSRGNEIFGNTIRGSHYAGVFFADGSDNNMIFDNAIFGATAWAMESIRRQANTSFNNLTNLKLRNISAGLDPNLLQLGAGQFDTP